MDLTAGHLTALDTVVARLFKTDVVTVGTAGLDILVNILNKELLLVLSGHSVPQRCMLDLFAFKVECVCTCASLVLPLCSVSAFTARSLQRLLEKFAG